MSNTHVDFTAIREDFSEYHVENGQILRFKAVLADVMVETKEDGKKNSRLGIKDLSTIITDVPIDTSNLEYVPIEQVTEKDHVKELKFRVAKNIINIYETQQLLILIAPYVINIFLTNKKDKTNNPILRYTYNTAISLIEKDSLYESTVQPTYSFSS